MNTLRLIYPQWQGGNIAQWFPEFDADTISRGYYLGSQLLNFLAPDNGQKSAVVPIATNPGERKEEDGVLDRDIIAVQTKAALDILNIEQPDSIVTLGGECSVSVVPFTWLADKYTDDVAMVWIDAHPDITLPGDVYNGYHAMAVTAIMGKGDEKIVGQLPATIPADKILFVGLRDWERQQIVDRQKQYGIKNIPVADTRENSDKVIDWLRSVKASKVVVHFDMDVLDPNDIFVAVGNVPDGMKLKEVARVINDIAREKDLVGLTVAEPMPRLSIRLKQMLSELPLLK